LTKGLQIQFRVYVKTQNSIFMRMKEVYYDYEFINSWMNEYLPLIHLLIKFFGKDLKILMSNK